MRSEILLEGCRPTPLAAYLKALGILRLVSEQADGESLGFWRNERFHLHTKLDCESLRHFFLRDYIPTPIIAPWNGASGFYAKDNQEAINAIVDGKAARFSCYREAVKSTRMLLAKKNIAERPTDKAKRDLIEAMRRSSNDTVVSWMDATVALTSNDELAFPPLLGTGGNDGHLDFTNNFMQRLVELFDASSGSPNPGAGSLLDNALFAEQTIGTTSVAVGQFSPGAAGGPNGSNGYESNGNVNPWDFILMLEGSLVFASGVSRRLEGVGSRLSSPFTFIATAAGFGTASAEEQTESRGELWAPLWSRPASFSEARTLFREGRMSLGRRRVKDGLDAARAASSLAADRRIDAFMRYGFLKRQGLSFLAVPLGRRRVAPSPVTELINDLYEERWLDNVRREAESKNAPAALCRSFHLMENALFQATNNISQTIDPRVIQEVLIAFGAIVRVVAQRPKLWEQVHPPKPLRAAWMQEADDRTADFRIAAALSGIHAREMLDHAERYRITLPMRSHIAPLNADGRNWDTKQHRFVTWSNGDLLANVCALIIRRLIENGKNTLHSSVRARAQDVIAFLSGSTDDRRIVDLLLGLAWVLPTTFEDLAHVPLPLSYSAVKPLFIPDDILQKVEDAERRRILSEDCRLPIPLKLPNLLMMNQVGAAVQCAMERARASGLPTPFLTRSPITSPYHGRRLLAALAIPIGFPVVRECLYQAYLEREKDTDDDQSEAS